VHVGDYIYEGGPGTGGVRQHSSAEPMEIVGYHEVENNYANLISQVDTEPDQDPKVFAKRRAAAYQAYYEFMPLRDASHPQGSGMQLYRELPMGDLLNFVVADTRQYRTDQPYNDSGPADGPDLTTPAATLPGIAQEQWIVDRMGASKSTWNVLAQQVLMASHDVVPGAPKGYSTDQWDAYRASRQRVLSGIHSRGTPAPSCAARRSPRAATATTTTTT
jgi:alkaline phosphatase D